MRGSTSLCCLRFALCLLLVGAGGCLVLPIPQSTPVGARVTTEDTSPFKAGVTTKAEIIQRLGTPQLELPELRLIAYEWDQVDYQVLYLVVGYGGAAGGVTDPKVPHALFVAFDQKDRVLAFSLERLGIWRGRPIQQTAREWAKRQGLAVPDLPSRFVALDTPTSQAMLYIYRTGGAPGPSPQVWVDGKLEAELKTGTYVASSLSPGNHMVKIVAIPESVPPDLGKTVSLDLAPSRKYFLSLTYPWFFGTGYLMNINLQPEEEAMPVLSQMAPAR